MKSTWKRLFTVIMVLCLLVSVVPVTVLAVDAEPKGDETTGNTANISAVIGEAGMSVSEGPMMQEAVDLAPGDFIDRDLYVTDFMSFEYAVNELTEAIKLRKEEIYIYLKSDTLLVDTAPDVMFLTASALLVDTYGGDYLMCSLFDYGYYAEYIEDGGSYYYIIGYGVMYSTTAEQEQELEARIQELRSTVLGDAASEYSKIKAIHDYIISNVEYDTENADNEEEPLPHTAYAALMQGKATAQGYVMLFDIMTRSYGITSNIIVGTVEGMPFMWNIVRCDDVWYNINIVADALDSTDAYFMKGSTDFPDDHVPAELYLTEEYVQQHPMAETAYMPEKAMSGKAGENAEWYYNALTNELSVVGSGRMDDEVQIPNIYGGNPALIIGEGITYIGANAFNNISIDTVQLPDTLTEIGAYAFANSNVRVVSGGKNLKIIGDGAFAECYNLTDYTIPASVTKIGSTAFYHVPMKQAKISAGVTEIGVNAFRNDTFEGYVVDENNPNYSSELGVLYNKDKTVLLTTPMVMTGDFVIPETVIEIGEAAFMGRGWCTSVTLHEGISKIGKDAFRNTALRTVKLPSTVTEIPDGAFAIESLEGITIPVSVTVIGKEILQGSQVYNIFYGGTGEQWDQIDIDPENHMLGIATIHESCNKVGGYGWMLDLDTGALTAEYLLHQSWRQWKDEIVSIELSNYANHVTLAEFRDCSNLKTLRINVESIYITPGAFEGCTALEEIYYCSTEGKWIENGLDQAFADFPDVTIHLKEIVTSGPVGDNLTWSFDEITKTLTISGQGPMCDFNEYDLRPWHEWLGRYSEINVVIEEGVTSVGAYAFINSNIALNIQFPSTMERICTKAFFDCNVGTLILNDGIKYIDEMAFCNCYIKGYYDADANKWYVNLVIPETVTDIGRRAFFGTDWREVYIPVSVKNIGEYGIFCNSETKIHYGGTQAQWKQVAVHSENFDSLKNPAVYSAGCPHIIVMGSRVEATCSEVGYTEGAYCGVCGFSLKGRQVIDKLAHTYENDICTVCGAENSGFTDVQHTDWFFAPVKWAVGANVTGGIGNNMFGPNNGCTRGQVVTFLWAANGKPEPKSMNNSFTDVSESDYYYKAVLWAVENGITGGIGEGLFGPNETCTRGQIVTFLWASQGKPAVEGSSEFTDVADTDWYVQPVLWAARNDVTGGIGNGLFGPNNTCTRGQVVTFLYKVYG